MQNGTRFKLRGKVAQNMVLDVQSGGEIQVLVEHVLHRKLARFIPGGGVGRGLVGSQGLHREPRHHNLGAGC